MTIASYVFAFFPEGEPGGSSADFLWSEFTSQGIGRRVVSGDGILDKEELDE